MASILLIFASCGGNTEIASEKVAEVLTTQGHEVTLKRAECATGSDFEAFPVVILASPTYGEGLLEPHMLSFVNKARGHASLAGKKCTSIGLGDAKYFPYYMAESAVILEEVIQEFGGEIIAPSLHINKSPVPQLGGSITRWAEQLAAAL
jgi:flavodoxin